MNGSWHQILAILASQLKKKIMSSPPHQLFHYSQTLLVKTQILFACSNVGITDAISIGTRFSMVLSKRQAFLWCWHSHYPGAVVPADLILNLHARMFLVVACSLFLKTPSWLKKKWKKDKVRVILTDAMLYSWSLPSLDPFPSATSLASWWKTEGETKLCCQNLTIGLGLLPEVWKLYLCFQIPFRSPLKQILIKRYCLQYVLFLSPFPVF